MTGSYAPLPYYPNPWPQTPYVMKLSSQGEVLYTTIFPGSGVSGAEAIFVDPLGQAYIAGYTNGDFPQIGGLDLAYRGAGYDGFVAKLGPGGQILYSTSFGAAGHERASGLGVDSSGAIYVSGFTDSPGFPRTGPSPLPEGEGIEVFVAKLKPGKAEPVWSFTFGGSGADAPNRLAVSPSGRSYLSGYTESFDFPTLEAYQTEHGGGADAFLVSFGASGDRVFYSTLLGGSGLDYGMDIAVDAAGNAWLGGYTSSADFPVLRPLQASKAGSISHYSDGFVSGFSSTGALTFSSYFGASEIDYVKSLALDRSGNLHIAGATNSALFPLKDPVQDQCGPVQSGRYCPLDVFVARIDPRTPKLLFSTYLGGSVRSISEIEPDDFPLGIAVDSQGAAVVVGGTYSRDFPLVNPIFTRNEAPVHFASFVTRILLTNQLPVCSAATASPSAIWPPDRRQVRISTLGVTDPDGDPVTLKITRILQDELFTARMPDAGSLGTAKPWVRADRMDNGDGRVYHLFFEATDPAGASCTGEVKVCVSLQSGGTCRDGGARFDSTLPR
ncbi:MAG TPA: SBBP repeat-containing protein [Thermoanaerobaculia bacterium]|nr:SBBP repeat-containing protein [Thermoanaerobaculia bacterium]